MPDRTSRPKTLRCAIYTRKSSEEGLEQDFNSLHAQRESCEAYIKSQRHEGWTALPTAYDDGGYSGGSMDRPALRKLLADIESRNIDVVVVYKVDRLTRSLADFAKIVEVFDAAGVSFVSVTQQFNTTTSMGRLTLNVLLSFAQFEREVTGERIRDKIAASKQKGMWMGGWVPIGYDRKDRSLVINEAEAKTVRTIFDLYITLGNVRLVQAELQRLKLTTKRYVAASGRNMGRLPFRRGHIYHLLSNPLYIGEIGHKGQRHSGQHPAIIDRTMWEKVQATLHRNRQSNRERTYAKSASLLAGLIYDEGGRRMISAHTTKNGKNYRYYTTAAEHGRTTSNDAKTQRLPATQVDRLVLGRLAEYLRDKKALIALVRRGGAGPAKIKLGLDNADQLAYSLNSEETSKREFIHSVVIRIDVQPDALKIKIDISALTAKLTGETNRNAKPAFETIGAEISLQDVAVRGRTKKVTIGSDAAASPDPSLCRLVALAHQWFEDIEAARYPTIRALAKDYGTDERYIGRVIPFAFLAPKILEQVISGRQPHRVNSQFLLTKGDLSNSWAKQVAALPA